ncbi:MAG: CPBP family intramembrane metalloprotease [Methylacidiphilales bacterium]|nr:CPBP family intramembrane metalloprotease [Candidatus Methylacidiphilales bacterium]
MSVPGNKPLSLFFLVIFLGAMVLGPLLYFALAGFIPFHRAMDRALLISAVAALALFWSRISLRELWPVESAAWKQLLFGWAAALVSAQALIGLDLAISGFTSSHLPVGDIMKLFLKALAAALIVPLLEETLFRGFLQTELIGRLGRRWGWLLAAAIYAVAHFLKIPSELDHQPVHLWSGITAVGSAFGTVFYGSFLCVQGLNLFLIGLILGGTFLRCGTLWFNAGLHGGWIFALLVFTGLTKPAEPPAFAWLASDLPSSLLTSVVLILLSLWLWRFYQPHSGGPGIGENAP